jgi:hypothetical protein
MGYQLSGQSPSLILILGTKIGQIDLPAKIRMKKISVTIMAIVLICPHLLSAEETGVNNPVHKYWTCTISYYHSLINGNRKEAQCRANTEYSEPPCRGFVVEYEGANGVRPTHPYERESSSEAFENSANAKLPTKTRIVINKAGEKFYYHQTVQQKVIGGYNEWVYKGVCNYNEAPAGEKMFMDYGLKRTR